jgi:hypothetical protein
LVERCEPIVSSASKDRVEVGGCSGLDAEPQLHGGAALDDEQVATVDMLDVVKHGAHGTDSDEVHYSLW